VVYEPKRMSGAELLAGFRYANERFLFSGKHSKAVIAVTGSIMVDVAAEPGLRLSVAKEGTAAVGQR